MRDRDRLLSDLAAALSHVPASRVVPVNVLALHLGLNRPAAVRLVSALSDAERQSLPWHRVVAEGGAIGRHALRDEQISRLRAEGVPVSPAGIIDEFRERAVSTLGQAAEVLAPAAASGGKATRSRGMRDRP